MCLISSRQTPTSKTWHSLRSWHLGLRISEALASALRSGIAGLHPHGVRAVWLSLLLLPELGAGQHLAKEYEALLLKWAGRPAGWVRRMLRGTFPRVVAAWRIGCWGCSVGLFLVAGRLGLAHTNLKHRAER